MGMHIKEHKYYYCNFVSDFMHIFLWAFPRAYQFHMSTAFLVKKKELIDVECNIKYTCEHALLFPGF